MKITLKIQGLLLVVIFIEGFVVLAAELLAIRLMLPFVGSGTEIVSIIISAVLMPLAFGYHYGASAYQHARAKARRQGKRPPTNRELLSRNALNALIILCFGLSYPVLQLFFPALAALGITNRLLTTSIYSALFLVTPVYLLGQTIPIISRYFRHARLHHLTGRMLYFSTLGSFLGSILTTLILMPFWGVHRAAFIVCLALTILAMLPLRRRFDFSMVMAAFFLLLAGLLNADSYLESQGIVSNNGYNIASINLTSSKTQRILFLNHSAASGVGATPEKDRRHRYITFFEEMMVPSASDGLPPQKILVLGAGGFTAGLYDRHNDYTYIDIDPALKDVAEQHFLKQKLHKNQHFIAQSARAYLNETAELYDIIFIDTYSHVVSVPVETISTEFLQAVRSRLKPDGVVVANVIGKPFNNEAFSQHYTNGFRAVFPHYWRQIVQHEDLRLTPNRDRNILFIGRNDTIPVSATQYHDLKNRYMYDR